MLTYASFLATDLQCPADGRTYLRAAAEKYPHDSQTWIDLAASYWNVDASLHKQDPRALRYYRKALTLLDEESEGSRMARALQTADILSKLGRYAEAAQRLEVRPDEDDPTEKAYESNAKYQLGLLHIYNLKDPRSGIDEIRTALALGYKEDWYLHVALSQGLADTQQWEDARVEAEKAVALGPTEETAHHHLGWVLSVLAQTTPSLGHAATMESAYLAPPTETATNSELSDAVHRFCKPWVAHSEKTASASKPTKRARTSTAQWTLRIGMLAVGVATVAAICAYRRRRRSALGRDVEHVDGGSP